jgi:hypothetical protein
MMRYFESASRDCEMTVIPKRRAHDLKSMLRNAYTEQPKTKER